MSASDMSRNCGQRLYDDGPAVYHCCKPEEHDGVCSWGLHLRDFDSAAHRRFREHLTSVVFSLGWEDRVKTHALNQSYIDMMSSLRYNKKRWRALRMVHTPGTFVTDYLTTHQPDGPRYGMLLHMFEDDPGWCLVSLNSSPTYSGYTGRYPFVFLRT